MPGSRQSRAACGIRVKGLDDERIGNKINNVYGQRCLLCRVMLAIGTKLVSSSFYVLCRSTVQFCVLWLAFGRRYVMMPELPTADEVLCSEGCAASQWVDGDAQDSRRQEKL